MGVKKINVEYWLKLNLQSSRVLHLFRRKKSIVHEGVLVWQRPWTLLIVWDPAGFVKTLSWICLAKKNKRYLLRISNDDKRNKTYAVGAQRTDHKAPSFVITIVSFYLMRNERNNDGFFACWIKFLLYFTLFNRHYLIVFGISNRKRIFYL